jgi:hypothetical protein
MCVCPGFSYRCTYKSFLSGISKRDTLLKYELELFHGSTYLLLLIHGCTCLLLLFSWVHVPFVIDSWRHVSFILVPWLRVSCYCFMAARVFYY